MTSRPRDMIRAPYGVPRITREMLDKWGAPMTPKKGMSIAQPSHP